MTPDLTWGLLTMLVSAIIGLTIALILIFIISSKRLNRLSKMLALALGFGGYLLWLFTIGDPRNNVTLESIYQKTMTKQTSLGS